jgi:hypothetical protein
VGLFVSNSEAAVGPGLQIIHTAFIYGLGLQSDWSRIMLHCCGVWYQFARGNCYFHL